VDETSDRMKTFEEQAKSDESLAKDALWKANQAKTSAQDAAKKVADSAKTVDGILDALGIKLFLNSNCLSFGNIFNVYQIYFR
jgi:hypothetical protein